VAALEVDAEGRAGVVGEGVGVVDQQTPGDVSVSYFNCW
jgi:hypothetical protein